MNFLTCYSVCIIQFHGRTQTYFRTVEWVWVPKHEPKTFKIRFKKTLDQAGMYILSQPRYSEFLQGPLPPSVPLKYTVDICTSIPKRTLGTTF